MVELIERKTAIRIGFPRNKRDGNRYSKIIGIKGEIGAVATVKVSKEQIVKPGIET